MVTEEFSFPKVITNESINLSVSQSLWRISSGVENMELEENRRSGRFTHKGLSENNEGGSRNVDVYEVEEEKMDMLWEDFNNVNNEDKFRDPSNIESVFGYPCPLSSTASMSYDQHRVMPYSMEGTGGEDFVFDDTKSEMGDLKEQLCDIEGLKLSINCGGSLSPKKQNLAKVLKVMKKLRLVQKMSRLKRRSSLF